MSYPLVAPYTDPIHAMQVLLPQWVRYLQSLGYQVPPTRWVRLIEQVPAPGLLPEGKSVFAHYEVEIAGVPEHAQALALVGTAPIDYASWMYYYSGVMAPKSVFRRNIPLLLQIWQSWHVSDATLKRRLQSAVKSMQEANRIYQEAIGQQGKAMDRTMADWAEMMRSNRTVEDQLTGERGEANLGWVNEIVNKLNEHEGWNRYKPIPLREQ